MIDINKKYKLRMNGEVHIYEKCEGKFFGKYRAHPTSEWNASRWEHDGHYQLTGESCLDLVEILPYADFKIDDKVLVWDDKNSIKQRGHFAGVDENGKPNTWYNGQTSFITVHTSTWNFCEKYEEQNDKT
jgi:hypothetical protein